MLQLHFAPPDWLSSLFCSWHTLRQAHDKTGKKRTWKIACSQLTNLFIIQIDVYPSFILYVGVERRTNKDICVPGGKNTSHTDKHTRLLLTTFLITGEKVEAKYFLHSSRCLESNQMRSWVFEISNLSWAEMSKLNTDKVMISFV